MSKKLQILMVEDDPSFQKIVELRLRSWNDQISLTIAGSLGEAKKIIEDPSRRFELAILDHHLPDGVGASLFDHPRLNEAAILAVSADHSPETPGLAVRAGAQHFLEKRQVSEPLFVPLLEAMLARKKLENELSQAKLKQLKTQTIKMLVSTLRHEINNPLGAVLGGTFLVRNSGGLSSEQADALKLIEASGNRIKHVLNQLCEAVEVQEVTKAQEQVFHIPGDKPWKK
jgi:signal transduction histidine kinase